MTEAANTSSRRKQIFLVIIGVVSLLGIWQYTTSEKTKVKTNFHPNLPRYNETVHPNTTANFTTRLTTTPPYFDFLRYKKGEKQMMLNDYALYHSYVLKGELPPRYFVMDTHTGVGLGNRFEQVQFAVFLSILSSRAFVSKWIGPYNLNIFVDDKDVNFYWLNNNFDVIRQQVNSSFSYADLLQLKPLLGNGSLIDSLGNQDMLIFQTFRVIEYPGNELYNNPLYKDAIPQVMENWKVTVTNFAIKKPVDSIVAAISQIKAKLQNYDTLITMQLRTKGLFKSPKQAQRIIECGRFFAANATNPAFYVSADNETDRRQFEEAFGDKLFTSGREPIHVAEYDPSNPPVERLEGVFIDWWMIGEGATKVISYLSSFGTSASDRTENPRILIAGLTQCSNSSLPGYLEKHYYTPLEQYERDGHLTYEYAVSRK